MCVCVCQTWVLLIWFHMRLFTFETTVTHEHLWVIFVPFFLFLLDYDTRFVWVVCVFASDNTLTMAKLRGKNTSYLLISREDTHTNTTHTRAPMDPDPTVELGSTAQPSGFEDTRGRRVWEEVWESSSLVEEKSGFGPLWKILLEKISIRKLQWKK